MVASLETKVAVKQILLDMSPHLDEKQRRILYGSAARVLGHGGIVFVNEVTGSARNTITSGMEEVVAGAILPHILVWVEFAVTGIFGRNLNTLAQSGRRIVKLIKVFPSSDPGRYIHEDIARTAGALVVAVTSCQDDIKRRAAEYAAPLEAML